MIPARAAPCSRPERAIPPMPEASNHGHPPIAPNALVRGVWVALGFAFIGLGFIGVVLPLVPTTPFVLLAAYCFARSSPRFYRWLLQHPVFGKLIRDWRAGRGIALRVKVTAVALIVLTIGSSAIFFVSSPPLRALLLAIGVGVTLFLLTRPTAPVGTDRRT
jgi:uncharacterized protein